MALATLSIDIVAQLAKMQEGLDRAQRLNEKAAAAIEGRWNTMQTSARALGGVLAGAFAGLSLGAFVNSTVDALDALNDLKDATGASIENLSALEDVARRNGGTLDEVGSILVKFNAGLKEADGKNGVSQALKDIGLNAEELRRLDPAEALQKTAKALSAFDDEGTKARITQELFGKSVRDAAPYLKDLAESGRLNATVTTEQAEQAERFNKQLFALQTNAGNLGRALATELLPWLIKFAELMERLAKNSGQMQIKFDVQKSTKDLKEAQATLENLQFMATNGPEASRGTFARRVDEQRAKVEQLAVAAQYATQRMKEAIDIVDPANFSNEGRNAPPKPKVGGISGSGSNVGGKDKVAALGAIRDAQQQYNADFLRSEKEVYGQVEEVAKNTFGAILDAQEQYKNDFLRSEKESYEQLGPVLDKTTQVIDDFAKRGQERIQDTLGDGLYDALSGNFNSIGDAFGNLLKRMVAESLAADIMGALFGKTAGGSGSILTAIATFFGGGRATGGPVAGGKMYEVNETGAPELLDYGGRTFLMNGKQDGYVRPLKSGGRGGAGGAVYNAGPLTVNVGNNVSLGDVSAAVTAGLRMQEQRFMRLRAEGRW